MKKKTSVFLSAVLLAASVFAPAAFAGPKQAAIVLSRDLPPYQQAASGIKQEFKKSGVEAAFDLYNIDGDLQKSAGFAREIQNKNTDIVFTIGTEAFKGMTENLKEIPVAAAMLVDPVGEGLVAPNQKNIYGAYLQVPFQERFRRLKKIVPNLYPVSLIYLKHSSLFQEADAAAKNSGFKLVPIGVSSIQEFPAALEQAARDSKALMMILDNDLYNSATSKELLLFSARNKFPVIAFSPNYVKSGALLSFSSDFTENGAGTARLAFSILNNESIKEH